MDLGFDRAGYKTLWQCEIEKRPRSILERHWPDATRYIDVATMKGDKVAPVDVISFGSPCQDLSIAGKRSGLAGARSGLFHQAIRIVKEMRKATHNEYPKAVVWENVAGALSSSQGNDFATVIDELAKSGAVDIQWSVLDAQHFGVPQRRRRIFLVAIYSRNNNPGEIFAEPTSSPRDTDSGSQEGQEAANDSPEGTGADSHRSRTAVEPGERPDLAWSHEVSPCVSSKWSKGTGGPAGDEVQNLCVYVKTKRAQSSNDDEAWATNRPSPTLNAMDNGSESRATVLGIATSAQKSVAFDEYNNSVAPIHQAIRSGTKQSTGVITGYTVRRLTPRECERLMGWPDDHTRWDADGNELADSPRYKACGNGVVAPVAEYVSRRLAAALQKVNDA